MPPLTILLAVSGVLSLMFLGTCISLWLVPIGMLYSDIQRGIQIILQFGIYLTPVIYPEPKIGIAAKLMNLNPVATLLTMTRGLILGTVNNIDFNFILVTILTIGFFIIGIFIYKLAMPIVIERIGS